MRLGARLGVSALLLVAAAAAPMRGAGPVLHTYPIPTAGSGTSPDTSSIKDPDSGPVF